MLDFIPTCRYHNSPMNVVLSQHGGRWAFLEVGSTPPIAFAGHLFSCPKCGYTEFFDDDPSSTAVGSEPLEPEE